MLGEEHDFLLELPPVKHDAYMIQGTTSIYEQAGKPDAALEKHIEQSTAGSRETQ